MNANYWYVSLLLKLVMYNIETEIHSFLLCNLTSRYNIIQFALFTLIDDERRSKYLSFVGTYNFHFRGGAAF